MTMSWTGSRKSFDVPCTVEIEQTSETLHAVEFGQRLVVRRTATVVRGGPLDRLRARIEGYLELTELYEVSFSDGRAT